MPLPTAPSTERTWLEALRTHLTTETDITWVNNPKPPVSTDPVAGLWVMQDFGFDRPNVIDALTRDQLLGVVWQVRGPRVAMADLATDWKNYIVTVFNDIRKTGITIGTNNGAFRGIQPYQSSQQSSSIFIQASSQAVGGNAVDSTAVIDYKLEFRYVYKLPSLLRC